MDLKRYLTDFFYTLHNLATASCQHKPAFTRARRRITVSWRNLCSFAACSSNRSFALQRTSLTLSLSDEICVSNSAGTARNEESELVQFSSSVTGAAILEQTWRLFSQCILGSWNAKPQAPDLGREGGGTCAAECVNIFPFFKMRLYANFFQLNLL